jgi:hypothetical protein
MTRITKSRLAALSQELCDILREQESELRKVIQGLRQQRQAFVSGRGEVLEESNKTLEALAARSMDLASRQKEIRGEISEFLGIPIFALTARRIASALEGVEGRQLIAQADLTKQVAKTLEVERRVGETLLEWSSQCHEDLLRQITEAYDESAVYSASGHQGTADKSARLFDAKA